MFLKICSSPKCNDSGKQVILVGYFRTMVWLLSLFLHSSFEDHNLKVFLGPIHKKIIPLSSHLPAYLNLVLFCSKVVALYMYISADYNGVGCVLIWRSARGLCSASLILPSMYSGNGLFRFLKNSCLHPKFKLKLVYNILKMLLVHTHTHTHWYS